MCGRFTQRKPAEVIAREFKVEVPELFPRYNIAPTQEVLAVREGGEGREAAALRWGLIPSWAKDPAMGARMINARAETIAEKPAFRGAYMRRRCLVPADGFYEWGLAGGRKVPYLFQLKGGALFGIAGLWERWEQDDEALETCALLTTEANETVRSVHDRMPVIISADDYDLWLDPSVSRPEMLQHLLKPLSPTLMIAHPVPKLVNNPGYDDPRCVEPSSR